MQFYAKENHFEFLAQKNPPNWGIVKPLLIFLQLPIEAT